MKCCKIIRVRSLVENAISALDIILNHGIFDILTTGQLEQSYCCKR